MAKGPIVTPDMAALIAKKHRQHPDWKAPRVRYEVEKTWRKDHRDSPVGFPSLSTVQRMLATIRKNERLGFSEDRPWTVDVLRDPNNRIPPEALPKVFQIWLEMQASSNSPPLTIREAKWIAQLSGMIDDLRFVRTAADMCAQLELIGELTETPQLSSASTMYLIYSLATRMSQEAFDELAPLIEREKTVSGSPRSRVMEILRTVYGDEFVKAVKPRSKKEGKNNERKFEGKGQE